MKFRSNKSAFTLIELLVVISIILIASSIIFIGGNGGGGAKLSSSRGIVSGIAKGARGQAILKNARTRLIIYTDNTANEDDEKKLRYFGIVYQDPDDDTKWYAGTQGTYLPEGIYFNEDLSQDHNWTRSTMNINYPRQSSQDGTSGEEYFYYEFNSNGTMASGFDNAWLVLQGGTLKPSDTGVLAVDFDAEEHARLLTALIFRRTGTSTPVDDPGDIIN